MSARRNLTFFATAILGTMVGTAAGLLLAPKSGEDTRRRIKRMAGEFSEQLPSLSEIKLKSRQFLKRAPKLLMVRRKSEGKIIQLYREKSE